ncbi:MAG: methylated-DNA--[protein]-cysteine S-methyltransferase [Sphingobacteriaceae bacterium]
MNEQNNLDYHRVAEAIDFINTNFKTQPTLDEIAEKVNLSPFHFQRLFTAWAGTSPKKFLQYISVEYAKRLLRESQISLFDAAQETGLSGPGRLHDLFINIEGMTPATYKNGGRNLEINYSVAESHFGKLLFASTSKGICYIAFADDEIAAFENLKHHFPNARFTLQLDIIQQHALTIFTHDWQDPKQIKLHLKGTDFQLKVWETLLKIPMGQLSTYGTIAKQIEHPNASRAVGSAIGANPVAFLIPCHRVIQRSGESGGYMWGATRKKAIIGWEASKMTP